MSSYKFFYIGCFLFTVLIFLLFAIVGKDYLENNVIIRTAEISNKSIAELFTKTIAKPYKKFISYLPCTYDKNNKSNKCPRNISEAKNRIYGAIKRLPVLNVRMFNHDGIDIMNGQAIDSLSIEYFNDALGGKTSSFIIEDFSLGTDNTSIIRTFIPIMIDNELNLDTIIAVDFNLSSSWKDPIIFIFYAIGGLTAIFAIIFIYMYVLSLRYEREFTKQYEVNSELEEEKATAEEENQSKSQFLANISHELRTPLNAIIGFSEIIKDEVMGPLNNQQYKEYITDIYLSGTHLLSLINDILDYSKADANKLNIEEEEVDVTKIMKNSLRLVSPRADESGVTLIGEIPKEHIILKTDGKRLKQILLNLFSNAVKFTPSGGTVTLYAWYDISDNRFIVEVKDTGVGIAPKDISKVMATFGQVENQLSRKYEGTGLGLPLTKKLVELMGGTLEIESELNVGTCVTISLPFVESDYLMEP